MSGCTATFPPNNLYCENEITIEYYFAVEGEPDYYLDATEITTAPRYIDSGVSRDVPIMCDGTFVAFNTPGIQAWKQVSSISDGYWPVTNEQFEMTIFQKNSPVAYPAPRYGLSNNIPLCRKTVECHSISDGGGYEPTFDTWDIGNYSVSGDTQWINDYLIDAYNNGCNGGHTEDPVTITGNPDPGHITIYINGEPADTNIVVKYNSSSITPYQYADFKFKSTGYTESTLRNRLVSGIPVYSQVHVYDGVKTVDDVGTHTPSWSVGKYSPNAFNLETDADGWTTVKTPLPIMQIANLAGIPATEIWISKNVKRVCVNNSNITGITYEGTKLDFRNVLISRAHYSLKYNGVQCSDGLSYGISDNYNDPRIGKSDPVVFKGNTIMPASCGNVYDGEEIEPGNTVTITFTGSTVDNSFTGIFFGFDGKELTPVSVVTGMSGEYATATLTFDEDVYYLSAIYEEWRAVSDVIRYIYPNSSTNGGSNLSTPPTKMRVIGGYYCMGKNFGEHGQLTFENLRAVIGENNFNGTGYIDKFSAPNLVYLAFEALRYAPIRELYIPSIQYMYTGCIPATCTALTIGKNISYMHSNTFRWSTSLTEVTFEGTTDDWDKMNELTIEHNPAWVMKTYSNITTVHCSDGDVTL